MERGVLIAGGHGEEAAPGAVLRERPRYMRFGLEQMSPSLPCDDEVDGSDGDAEASSKVFEENALRTKAPYLADLVIGEPSALDVDASRRASWHSMCPM